MTTYTLSKTIEEGITRLVDGCVRQTVEKLSLNYGFDMEEAMGLVGCVRRTDKVGKTREETKKTKKPTIPLPYCDKIFENKCFGIRINHGLHTQCTQERCEGSDYCKTCDKQSKNSENNKPNAGDIRDRSMDTWTPCSKLVKYGNVMEKLGITREEAEKVAAEHDLTIPEDEFEIVKGRRGRPKKDNSVCSSDDENTTTTKRSRGRPKKTKTVISTSSGDDLIAQLVSAANAETICHDTDSDSEVTSPNETTNDAKKDAKAEKEAAKAAAKAEKEAAKAAAKAEKEAAKAEKEAAKAAAKAEKEAAKAEKEAAKAAAKAEKEAAKAAAKAEKEAAKAEKEAAKTAAKAEKEAEMAVEEQKNDVEVPRPTLVAVTTEQVETETLAPRSNSNTEEDSEVELEEDEMTESDDEAEVVPKTIQGKEYLVDCDTNEVYDRDTHDLVGYMDDDGGKVIPFDDME